MAQRQILARDLMVDVLAADGTTWVPVDDNNTNMTLNPGANSVMTDTTTAGNAGVYSQIPAQRGAQVVLTGRLTKDHITGAQDTGQARCEVLAAAVGYDGLGGIRFRHPVDTVWKVWTQATFELGEQGADVNGMTAWACTVTRCIATTTMAVA